MNQAKIVIKLILSKIAVLFFCGALFSQDSEVAVTVYNNNLGLVQHIRTLDLQRGISEIKFYDVAAQIDPTSVSFSSLTAPDDVTILEQNYEYDLLNSGKILQKYVGKEIVLDAKEGVGYAGILLSAAGSDIILQESDGGIKVVRRETVENISFPMLPDGLVTRPTLVWRIENNRSGKHKTEVGYLTSGIEWHAEYIAVTNTDDTMLDLSAWISIDNKSGASYKNAKLKLVAGDVHRARKIVPYLARAQFESAKSQVQEKAFFEYHLYSLKRKTTIANNQIKQISLFPSAEVRVSKLYLYDSRVNGRNVQVNLEFANRRKAGLGLPLPGGKIRIYKKDSDGSLIFIGEDFVEHTPVDEVVKVKVGNAFDLVAERRQTKRRQIAKNSREEHWEISLRNHKDLSVEIKVFEHLNNGWEILHKSHEFTLKNANTIQFPVKVAAKGSVTLEYVVRYTF